MKKRRDDFKTRVLRIFDNLKHEREDPDATPLIPIFDKGRFVAYLRAISVSSIANSNDIKDLASWRKKHNRWFPAQFEVTVKGTRKWLENLISNQRDRLLFMLETPSGMPFGHMGYFRFDFENESCEVDNIVRGRDLLPGVMTPALKSLINWAFSVLSVKTLFLKTYLDNKKAIALYKRCGFTEVKKIPLKKVVERSIVRWEEDLTLKKPKRYNLQMKFVESNIR